MQQGLTRVQEKKHTKKSKERKGRLVQKDNQHLNQEAIQPLNPVGNSGVKRETRPIIDPNIKFFSEGLDRFSNESLNAYSLYLRKKKEEEEKDLRRQLNLTNNTVGPIHANFVMGIQKDPNLDDKGKEELLKNIRDAHIKEAGITNPEAIDYLNQVTSYNAMNYQYTRDTKEKLEGFVNEHSDELEEAVSQIKVDVDKPDETRKEYLNLYNKEGESFTGLPEKQRDAFFMRQAMTNLRKGNVIAAQAASETKHISFAASEQIKDRIRAYKDSKHKDGKYDYIPMVEQNKFKAHIKNNIVPPDEALTQYETLRTEYNARPLNEDQRTAKHEYFSRVYNSNVLFNDVKTGIDTHLSYEDAALVVKDDPMANDKLNNYIESLMLNSSKDPESAATLDRLIERSGTIPVVKDAISNGLTYKTDSQGVLTPRFKGVMGLYSRIVEIKGGRQQEALQYVSPEKRMEMSALHGLSKSMPLTEAVKIINAMNTQSSTHKYNQRTNIEADKAVDRYIQSTSNNNAAFEMANLVANYGRSIQLPPDILKDMVEEVVGSYFYTDDENSEQSLMLPRSAVGSLIPAFRKYTNLDVNNPEELYRFTSDAIKEHVQNFRLTDSDKKNIIEQLDAAGIDNPEEKLEEDVLSKWFWGEKRGTPDLNRFNFNFYKESNKDALNIKYKAHSYSVPLVDLPMEAIMYNFLQTNQGKGYLKEGMTPEQLKEFKADYVD